MDNKKKQMPDEIGRANEHDLKIIWKDGQKSIYPARALRLKRPCALCVEEFSRKPLINEADIVRDVHPVEIKLVGKYAIGITWSDGHDTGIYSFENLRDMEL